jgi:hypothetical protein
MEQLRLQVGSYSHGSKGGTVEVLWKTLDIRAERIERQFAEVPVAD